jgi:hypothetical protein
MLNAVHAGGEQGWESGHLEPFFLAISHQRDTFTITAPCGGT